MLTRNKEASESIFPEQFLSTRKTIEANYAKLLTEKIDTGYKVSFDFIREIRYSFNTTMKYSPLVWILKPRNFK